MKGKTSFDDFDKLARKNDDKRFENIYKFIGALECVFRDNEDFKRLRDKFDKAEAERMDEYEKAHKRLMKEL